MKRPSWPSEEGRPKFIIPQQLELTLGGWGAQIDNEGSFSHNLHCLVGDVYLLGFLTSRKRKVSQAGNFCRIPPKKSILISILHSLMKRRSQIALRIRTQLVTKLEDESDPSITWNTTEGNSNTEDYCFLYSRRSWLVGVQHKGPFP